MADKADRKKKATAERQRLPVYLDRPTKAALRIRAIEEGTTASAIVERLITEYLKRKG